MTPLQQAIQDAIDQLDEIHTGTDLEVECWDTAKNLRRQAAAEWPHLFEDPDGL